MDDLTQSPTTMSSLEVLQTCLSQKKALMSTLSAIYPSDSKLMVFDLDKAEPHMPSSIAFRVLVTIRNFIIHQCIIDEGASTCIMSVHVWRKLGSPELLPSSITLHAYDGHPLQPQGLFSNVPIELSSKNVLVDIEVVDAPLDYNILLGRSYMYAMKVVPSIVFHLMMFPHNSKVVTLDQITYHDPKFTMNPKNVLPAVEGSLSMSSFMDVGPRIFRDSTMIGTFSRPPPIFRHKVFHICALSPLEILPLNHSTHLSHLQR